MDKVDTNVLLVKKLSKTAQLPKRGSEGAAGLDLYADIEKPKTHYCYNEEDFVVHSPTDESYQCKICSEDYIPSIEIPPHGKALIPLNIAVSIPQGYYGRIAPRSSLAMKHIDVGAGVADSDYRGALGVVLYNLSPDNPFVVRTGDRIAQLILQKISVPSVREVDELDSTDRGSGGFGSTGK